MYAVILGIDIEDFSQDTRTDALIEKRKQLSSYLERAAKGYNKFIKDDYVEAGDGGYFIIQTGDFEPLLLFLQRVEEEFNNSRTIRARCILHTGTVERTPQLLSDSAQTFIGQGINNASRYLNADCLKMLLKLNESDYFVSGLSNDFYEKIYNESFYRPDDYIRYSFKEKKYGSIIYLKQKDNYKLPSQDKISQTSDINLNDTFAAILKQSEFTYQSNGILSDLSTFFIYPEFLIEGIEEKHERITDSEKILNVFMKNPQNILIAGSDQSGKSSLAKVYFAMLFESKQYLPILITCHPNEKGNISNKINDAVKSQYAEGTKLDGHLIVVLIDDFHLLDDNQQRKTLAGLEELNNIYVVLFVDSIYNGSLEKRTITEQFNTYSIREFGHAKRKELIDKWIEFNSLCNENYCDTDTLSEYVDLTLIKGLIPYSPFYILTVLAARSDFVPLNGELTSKGHCYQALIYISLRKLGIPDGEIGAFLNIFSFIAYHLFKNNIGSLSHTELEAIIDKYSQAYNFPFEIDYLFKRFEASPVFHRNSLGTYSFHAAYLLHYFTAKYLAEHLSEPICRKAVEEIYNNLHESRFAYIGIFIVHHSKDARILDEILVNTMVLFDSYPEATLSKEEMHSVDEYAQRLNAEVIEEYDQSAEKRRALLHGIDKVEIESEKNQNQDVSVNEELKTLKKAIRTVEVMGQILKNHSGEIDRKSLKECYLNGLNAYRRICTHFLNEFTRSEKEFADFIVDRIVSLPHNSFTREQLYEYAQNIFGFFSLTAIFATVKRSADALGSKEMMKIIKEVTDEIDSPLAYCVYLQSLMWYRKEVPLDELKLRYKDLPSTVQHVVQRLIKEYTDLHHIKHQEKQKIAHALNMRLESLDFDHSK